MTGKFHYQKKRKEKKKTLIINNNSYWGVRDFTSASMVYVTVNGFPSNVWKANALPVNANEPTLMGESVNFINEIATFHYQMEHLMVRHVSGLVFGKEYIHVAQLLRLDSL